MTKKQFLITLIIFVLIVAVVLFFIFKPKKQETPTTTTEVQEEVIPEKFGISLTGWELIEDTVRQGDYIGGILNKYGISSQQIHKVVEMSCDTFRTTLITVGNLYTIFYDTIIDEVPQAKIFVYENSKMKYTLYDFRNPDTVYINRSLKQIDTITNTASGIIEYSLWQTMIDNGYNWDVALALSQTFAWTVDFYSLQKQDWFKVIYDEYFVDNERVGLGEIKAGVFHHGGKELWAIPFVEDSVLCFYDTLGNSMRKTFMPAPLEYTHIGSRYSHARMHPIHHVVTPHLAVDFSAPTGTPVYAASDGTIVIRTYGTGAGNYVKIRHNSVYSTVYMHFSKFGKYQVGDRVNQGDIIGYVGSTGWSTGPHLHYEIHENGKKIDPLKFEPPPAEPVDSIHMERFNKEKRKWIDDVNKIKLPN
ncbi:MAG TPA: peptidoglycan DD-metalloendopeptidase family protein [Bacteroidales bacterium]|nr:peptidoglycan DD-metalloendopeptidase family protein [Bacteroidales bacterium]HOR59674.1 peptidoglycan DD-metalloendopeptidase family protein [Bacteroidales bacterium]HPL04189.1 peptidoglycan DD-metalloendopeptidase family protein [Bacteroidales bacterium]